MEKKQKKAKWTEQVHLAYIQELTLLKDIYPLQNSKRWKQMSEIFRQKGFHRSEIELREKWINFLDPELNKSDWEVE